MDEERERERAQKTPNVTQSSRIDEKPQAA